MRSGVATGFTPTAGVSHRVCGGVRRLAPSGRRVVVAGSGCNVVTNVVNRGGVGRSRRTGDVVPVRRRRVSPVMTGCAGWDLPWHPTAARAVVAPWFQPAVPVTLAVRGNQRLVHTGPLVAAVEALVVRVRPERSDIVCHGGPVQAAAVFEGEGHVHVGYGVQVGVGVGRWRTERLGCVQRQSHRLASRC